MIVNWLISIGVSFVIHFLLLGLAIAIAQYKWQPKKMILPAFILAAVPCLVYFLLAGIQSSGIDITEYSTPGYLRFISTSIRIIFYATFPLVFLRLKPKDSLFVGVSWFFLAFLAETIVDQIW